MGGVVATAIRTDRRNSVPATGVREESRHCIEQKTRSRRRSRSSSVPMIATESLLSKPVKGFTFNEIRYRDPDILLPETLANKLVKRLEKWDPEDSDWNFGLEKELLAAAKDKKLTYNNLLRQLELVSYTMQLRNSMGTIHEKLQKLKQERTSERSINNEAKPAPLDRRRSSLVAMLKDMVPSSNTHSADNTNTPENDMFDEMNSSQEDKAARKRYHRYVEALDAVVAENELKYGKSKELKLTESVHFLRGLAEKGPSEKDMKNTS